MLFTQRLAKVGSDKLTDDFQAKLKATKAGSPDRLKLEKLYAIRFNMPIPDLSKAKDSKGFGAAMAAWHEDMVKFVANTKRDAEGNITESWYEGPEGKANAAWVAENVGTDPLKIGAAMFAAAVGSLALDVQNGNGREAAANRAKANNILTEKGLKFYFSKPEKGAKKSKQAANVADAD